jgi:chondroitin AC lyase
MRPVAQTIAVVIALAVLLVTPPADADDLATITQRVTAQLLSSVPSTSTVQGYMNSLQSNGSWSDINYANMAQTNWTPLTHLQRLEAMAEDYSSSSSTLYHNATLGADISNAYNYWISVDPQSTNWFDNDIATPQNLGQTMVLVSNSILSPSQISLGQNILARAKGDIPSQTGQNVVDEAIAGIYSAIVSGSNSDMSSAFGSIGGTITVISAHSNGNGIQADHSYEFHGPQLYMGGYGTSYINDTLNWAAIGAGTQYDQNSITTNQLHLLVDYLLDGTQWFIRGKTMDLTADGRQVTFSSFVGAGDGFVTAINNALALGTYRQSELQAFLARQQATISSGQASTTANVLSGNRDFFDSEAMVQQRAGYYASVKVTSTRTSQPEQGNSQGLKNLYLGDGVNQIMVTGNEYLGIQPSWNWRRLPGTTVEQDSRSLTPPGTFGATKGTTAYAGGVSDETYGAEAFAYNRFDVAAQKSWFFFNNEEVALGGAINAPNATSEVDTTLNQCLLTSTVSYETTASSTIQTLTTGTVTPTNLKWVYQGGVGYFFLTPVSNATIMAVAQSGTWAALNTAESSSTVTQNVFTLYINHGTAVNNGSYSYIVVPNTTAAQMDSYFASTPIQFIRNDATVQAVRNSALDLTEAAFYAADSFTMVPGQTVGVNAPSTIMLQRPQANVLKLSASNPQAAALALQVQLTGVTLSGSTSTWFDALGNATATFNLPGGNLGGSTSGITLSSDGNANPTVSLTSNDQLTNSTYAVSSAIALPNNTTFNADQFSTLSFTNTISGLHSITKTGAGTLALSGSNNFAGGLIINGGYVRALSVGAPGSGSINANATGTLVIGANLTNPIALFGGALAFTGAPTFSGNLTAEPGTTSTIESFDPLAPTTSVNETFTGNLQGSGNIILQNATGITSPDGGQGFRINAANSSNFSGTITLSHNVKSELFGTTSGSTTPVGTGTIVLTAGDAALGGTVNTVTTTGGYSELNLRNNTTGSQIYGNNVQVVGSGLVVLNPLGTAAAGLSDTLGSLTIGGGQQLGIYLASSANSHPIVFQSVTLDGGVATFAPKINGFGASNSTGADLYLGTISESVAGSGINMSGLRTLFLTGADTYTGATTVSGGALQLNNSLALQDSTLNYNNQGGTLSFGTLTSATFGGLSGSQDLALTNTSSAPVALTLGNNTATYFGALSGGGSLIQNGPGTTQFLGTSTYTGTTTITSGTLSLLASNAIAKTSQVILGGGTFATNGFGQDFTTSASPATLGLTANSILDFGAGGANSVKFADSHANSWSGTLAVNNWTFGADHLMVGTSGAGLTATQLNDIQFADFVPGASITGVANSIASAGEVTPRIGDINQDGSVNSIDLVALMQAMIDLGASGTSDINSYAYQHPAFSNADIKFILDVNGDGRDTNADVQALINYLLAGHGNTSPVPEPSAWVLLALGAVWLVRQKRRD